jgi:DMSO/TMAO reductase YedYZ molybdopterin-dependent catalytic subunit
MNTRRQFIRKLFKAMIAGGLLGLFRLPSSPVTAGMLPTAELPRHTDPQSLINRNPRLLDTRHLDVMALKDFKTMGLSDHRVDLADWRLEIGGSVQTPLSMTYAELKALPKVTANVLLICPGVFCNHGRWQGVSIRSLLAAAGAAAGVTHVTVQGPTGPYRKTHRLKIEQLTDDRAFLAYAVNDSPLPVAHGFPLRLVSKDDYGFDWIKYVDRIEAIRIQGISSRSGSNTTTF